MKYFSILILVLCIASMVNAQQNEKENSRDPRTTIYCLKCDIKLLPNGFEVSGVRKHLANGDITCSGEFPKVCVGLYFDKNNQLSINDGEDKILIKNIVVLDEEGVELINY